MSEQIDGPASARRSKSGSALKSVTVRVLAAVIGLAVAESGLRVFGYHRPPEYPPAPVRPDLYVDDSAFGYHLWPLSRTCMRYPAHTHRMVALISNADGFASSRNLGEPDPRPRVLVIGDSFTMGLGINEGKRYTEVVENLEPRWRVDNMGMTGWGLDLMVRALEALGKKAQPTVVVLAIYTDDLTRLSPRYVGVAGRPYTKFKLVGGKLVDTPPFKLAFWHRFHLSELLRAVNERLDPRARNRYPLNEALLNRFHDLTAELNATPVVLFLPGRVDSAEDRERRAFLREWAEAKGVVYRDLTEVVHGPGVEETYFRYSHHWNEHGHELVGRGLHELLATSVLRGKGAGIEVRTLPPPSWRQQRFDYCTDHGDSAQGSVK
ncbi:MAG: SGNH/GDSL hydrolase family protein [Gemmatimonadaceae bacterium]|nr:SGNH/GDSL hydrolase family protein [Gemmatimonadaceae bacterium]